MAYKKITDKFIIENEATIRYALSIFPFIDEYEDILQEARLCLITAWRKFDPKKSSWKTYAVYQIRKRYRDYIRSSLAKKRSPVSNGYVINSFDAFINDGNNIEQAFLVDDGKLIDETIYASDIYSISMKLITNEKYRKMVQLRLTGMEFKEIGNRMGVTKQWVQYIYKKEMDNIKKYFYENVK
jgi:RNA polymerase sigma factor (sigma-70 family)